MVDDVVEVGAAGCRAEERGEVEVADAKGYEVVEMSDGVREREVRIELEAVRGRGDGGVGAVAQPSGSLG